MWRQSAWTGLLLVLLACPVEAQTWTISCAAPGQVLLSPDGLVEYQCGNVPVLFTVPHGGSAKPSSFTIRTAASCVDSFSTANDTNTRELGNSISSRFTAAFPGRWPHKITNLVHRSRLDMNRDKPCATANDPDAERTWDYFHAAVAHARAQVPARAMQFDIHGHNHDQRVEIAYGIPRAFLYAPEAYEHLSTIRAFAATRPPEQTFTVLLRSLGTLLRSAGYDAIPSSSHWEPEVNDDFFSGGYLTLRYGCPNLSDTICAIQLEHPMKGYRGSAQERTAYATALVQALHAYLPPFGIAW